ncbi:hypothetical protein SBRCBS47491_002909 [Sporothrix bragantina]|uniref:U6 small nuclear RNA (adenine-(43)-N(6))-methyltransferase n=1 Tax=Sporothrix bragantina TaxID=671064 RepID=A0ABP0BB32_9PEZI
MADDTCNDRRSSVATDVTDVAATPASTSSLYVVDDQQRRLSQTPVPSSSSPSASSSRPFAFYRDLYTKDRLDFRALARDDPAFASVCTRPGQIDFRDPAAVRQLTVSLLRRDFGLTVTLPHDRLCPPVPNRLSYVIWVTELVAATENGPPSPVVGLDIGTGASCIYPLLACTVNPSWQCVATDIDAESLTSARANVERNLLKERIKVITRSPDGSLVAVDESDTDKLTFSMCNPPFYASADEMAASATAKQQPPYSACTGAPVEMVYSGAPLSLEKIVKIDSEDIGGEIAFVGRILAESLKLRNRVRWYTAMLGKLASLVALVTQLRAHGIDNYAVTALVHGSKTRRWVLGWSFGPVRPTVAVARGGSDAVGLESYRHLLPAITEVEVFSVPRTSDAVSVGPAVDTILRGLELTSWDWDDKTLQGVGRTRENVWGRAWRRKKQREERGDVSQEQDIKRLKKVEDGTVFGFVVTIRVGVAGTVVHCRWLEGHNEAIYQSFCGFLKTKLKESTSTKSA